MNAAKYLRSKLSGRFIRYVLIGFSGLTLDLLAFIVLVRFLQVNEYIANPISMSLGILNNFFLNAFFNFKRTDKLLFRLVSFYLVGVIGILVGNAFLWLFMVVLGNFVHAGLQYLSPVAGTYQLELVKGASVIFIAILQYLLNKKFSFAV